MSLRQETAAETRMIYTSACVHVCLQGQALSTRLEALLPLGSLVFKEHSGELLRMASIIAPDPHACGQRTHACKGGQVWSSTVCV